MNTAPLHPGTTVTDADWRKMFAAHRALGHYHGNSILRQIRERVAIQSLAREAAAPSADNSAMLRPKPVQQHPDV